MYYNLLYSVSYHLTVLRSYGLTVLPSKRTCLLLILYALLIQGAWANDLVTNHTITMMSYNIRNARGMDNITDYQRLADVILREEPDIVTVQEIDSVTVRSKGVDVLQEIAQKVRMHAIYGASIEYDGGKYGLGILSKERPLSSLSVPLPGREELRQLLIVEYEHYFIGCTHLSLTGEDRMASIEIIRKEAAKLNKPFFLTGDFNASPDSDFITELHKDFSFLNDTGKLTFPSDTPRQCIDYITFYDKGVKQIEARPFTVISNRVVDEKVASDHRPVVVRIHFIRTR